jgi:cytochrome P450
MSYKFQDILLAAIDIVSSTIEFAMAEILQDQQIMTKLQEELKRVIVSKKHVEYSDINQLPYLQAVIKETLRMHPVAPMVPNKAEATVEIQGYIIPKGSTVLVNLWAIHHDPEVWTEPDKFIPERFLKHVDVNFHGVDYRFIPFSAGRRICLGMPLATRMLHAMLGSMLHRFDWSLPLNIKEKGVDMSEKLWLTMTMATPLQAIVKPR